MSWDRGEAPAGGGRSARPLVVLGCVLAVVLVAFLARRAAVAPPGDELDVSRETPGPVVPAQPEPRPPRAGPDQASGSSEAPAGVERLALGPLLPDAQGLTLWAATGGGELVAVDLTSGDLVLAQALDRRSDQMLLLPDGNGGMFVATMNYSAGQAQGGVFHVTAPDHPPTDLGPAAHALASATPGRVWLVDGTPGSLGPAPMRLREVTADGATTAEVTLPPGVHARAALDDGLLLTAGGTLVVHDPATGRGRRLDDGELLGSTPGHLARRTCDPTLRCFLVAGTLDDPDRTRVPLPTEGDLAAAASGFSYQAALSPDGRWLASVINNPASAAGPVPVVLEVATGRVLRAPEAATEAGLNLTGSWSGPVWAPSSRWLFLPVGGGDVVAWDPEREVVHPLDLNVTGLTGIAVG